MSRATTPPDPTQASAASLVNGKVAKLRASCDACNESKVRCSQTKPRCARCEKQGIRCIYGLSRRSHKTAPRIGASSTSHSATLATATGAEAEAATATTAASLAGGAKPKRQRRRQHEEREAATAIEADNQDFLGTLNLDLDMYMQSGAGSGLDLDMSPSSTLGTSFDPMDGLLTPLSSYDYLDHQFMPTSGANAVSDNYEGFFMEDVCSHSPSVMMQSQHSGFGMDVPSMNYKTCDCTTRIARKLSVIPASFPHDGMLPFDVQLSQLKRAIKLSEEVLQCDCASWDEMTIMSISVVVGRVVQGFEATLAKAISPASLPTTPPPGAVGSMADLFGGYATPPLSSAAASLAGARGSSPNSIGSMSGYGSLFRDMPAATSSSSPSPPLFSASCSNAPDSPAAASAAPRLSWGVLQVDYDDDVDDLKQHLWLVHFRKLEALLRRFGSVVRLMRNNAAGAGTGCSAQILACEGVHRWLDQKARTVRDMFEARDMVMVPDGGRH